MLKKRYILILALAIVALGMSHASAHENTTDALNEQGSDMISISDELNDTVSISSDESEALNVNNCSNETSIESTEVLKLCPKDDQLSTQISVTPLSSGGYKTPTKRERTFTIGAFKAVLSPTQYKKLYMAPRAESYFFEGDYQYYYVGEKYGCYRISSSGLWYSATVKTNKFVNVKVKIGGTYKIKRTRVLMNIRYGAGQSGVAYRYMATLTHQYANPGYDYVKVMGKSSKYFSKCKYNASLKKLNRSKLYSQNSVYRNEYRR